MKPSDFQFSNPQIEKIDFRICENKNRYKNQSNMPVQIKIETNYNKDNLDAIVNLFLTIGKLNYDKKVITPFYFNGKITSNFTWTEEFNTNNIEKTLKINGGTVLLSYIRPIVSMLTLQSGIKPLNLPFIDLLN